MTVSLKHKFVNPKPDGVDTTVVRPSDWNDEHELELNTNRVLGRSSAGVGPAEEMAPGQNISFDGNEIAFDGILPLANGGLGTSDPATARDTLDAAKLGVNSDITELRGLTGPIETPDYIQFDTSLTPTPAVGKMGWDDEDGTLQLGLKGGNVNLQLGQEEVHLAVNKSGVALVDGNVVAILGAQGNRISITRAQGNAEATSVHTFGLCTEHIGVNQTGFVTTSGIIRGLNTLTDSEGNALVEGDTIYLSTTVPGGYTKIKPIAPNHMVILGFVVRVNANNGQIFVKVDNGYELNELHNVRAFNPQDKNVLAWNAALQVWDDTNISKLIRSTNNGAQLSGTFTINCDIWDQFNLIGISGTVAFAKPSGNPSDGQKLMIRVKDNGTPRYVGWDTTLGGFRTIGTILPSATVGGKTLYVGSIYNAADGYWDVVAVAQEA